MGSGDRVSIPGNACTTENRSLTSERPRAVTPEGALPSVKCRKARRPWTVVAEWAVRAWMPAF